MKKKIAIIDSTLRDGEQTPGLVFSEKEKLYIAKRLSDIGADEIEAGIPVISRGERETIKKICKMNLSCDISVWSRAVESDIYFAAEVCASIIHISFPFSDILLSAMAKDFRWAFRSLKNLTGISKKYFDHISIGIQDALRCDKKHLLNFIQYAGSLNVNRVRLADTVGIGTPLKVYHLVREIKEKIPDLKIGFHAHNDLGMATANSIAAIEAGADSVDVTVNGVGERCGNAPMEEVALALKYTGLHYCNINGEMIPGLCEEVAKICNQTIPANKPVTGKAIFTHESGTHLSGILNDPVSYQPFLPDIVGRENFKMIAGKHSGTSAIRRIYQDIGIIISFDQARFLTGLVKEKAIEMKRSLSEEELISIYKTGSH